MNIKDHRIFKNEDSPEPEKESSIKSIRIFRDQKNTWAFHCTKGTFGLAPAPITRKTLSPIIWGADKIIKSVTSLKKIDRPEDGFNLLFSNELFLNCDARLVFEEKFHDGWIYKIEPEYLDFNTKQKIFACSYLKLYFSEPPENVFVKLEKEE